MSGLTYLVKALTRHPKDLKAFSHKPLLTGIYKALIEGFHFNPSRISHKYHGIIIALLREGKAGPLTERWAVVLRFPSISGDSGFMIIRLLLTTLFCLQWGLTPVLHAKVQHEKLAPQGNFIPKDPAFDSVRSAYKAFNFRKAIQKTERLNRLHKTPKISEDAAFLIGDLYLIMAEKGRPLLFRKALDAYREAHFRYPESERTPSALMTIGMIFLKEALYYEALATFDRIIKKYPNTPFVISAQINKGDVFLQWGKYDKAISAFDKVNPAVLSTRESTFLLLNYAEAYYLKKEYRTAYGYYELISPQNPTLQGSKKSLYQYGISAYKSGAYTNSRELLFILHNKYPKSTYSLLALARIGDSLRLQGKITRAKKTYKQVYTATGKKHHHQSASLIAAIGAFHIAGCDRMQAKVSKNKCFKGQALNTEEGRIAYKKVKASAERLLRHHKNRPDFIDQLILETAEALEIHKLFTESLKIKQRLIKQKISKLLKKKIKKSLPKTVISSVNQLFEKGQNIEALNTYYKDQAYFSPKILKGRTGLYLGIAFKESGLYQEAIDLLLPISRKQGNKQGEKAQTYLIKAYYQQQKYTRAERQKQKFIKDYPSSKIIPELESRSAEASLAAGKTKLAIKKFKRWLSRYPKSSEQNLVWMHLGDAYTKNGDLDQALESYLKIKEPTRKQISGLYLKIADTFFKLKNYKRCISFYAKTIAANEGDEALTWASFQIAQSYEKLGMRDKGLPIYSRLETGAGGLIRALSEQKAVELAPKIEVNASP